MKVNASFTQPVFLVVTRQTTFSIFCFQPLETKLISETSGVCQPDHVAKIIVRDAVVRNRFSRSHPFFFLFQTGFLMIRPASVLVYFLTHAAGEFQQFRGTGRLHAFGRHLRNVTGHLHHGRPAAGNSVALPKYFWALSDDISPDALLRSSPWGCSAPSPSSTWGASTASCAAA